MQRVGNGDYRLPQAIGADRTDTADPECIDGCQFAWV
jgi:hypothetical protein